MKIKHFENKQHEPMCKAKCGKKKKGIPVYNVGGIGMECPSAPELTEDTPITSWYSGKIIGYGGVPWGVKVDVAPESEYYGDTFHGIIYNYLNDSYVAHEPN
jgi:hypothetical protein